MFSTGVRHTLTARHFLRGDFGDESVPHAHPYEVELICQSAALDENGFSTDIAAMETGLAEVLGSIDNVLLNDLDEFRETQPSLENLAVYLTRQLREWFVAHDVSLAEPIEIRIWEAPTAWAAYRE